MYTKKEAKEERRLKRKEAELYEISIEMSKEIDHIIRKYLGGKDIQDAFTVGATALATTTGHFLYHILIHNENNLNNILHDFYNKSAEVYYHFHDNVKCKCSKTH